MVVRVDPAPAVFPGAYEPSLPVTPRPQSGVSVAGRYLADGLMLLALAFALPFVILAVGAPLALVLRVLTSLF